LSFQGKTIVITGASDGIGAELARQLAVHKPNLVLAARRLEVLNSVAAQCTSAGAQVLALRCDVGVQADCNALIDAAAVQFGGVDMLVNNAGVSMHAKFSEIADTKVFEDLMRINLMGAVWLTHRALPHIRKSRGLIVGVSSLAGLVGVPERTTYCATKHAMTGFFDALRVELAPEGVDVTMIYPGVVATEIRRNGWNASGQKAGVSGLEERGAMTVQDCAAQIVQAMRTRKRKVVMTAKGKVGLWLNLIAPKIVDNIARAALAKQPQ
jgi:short-subunit dehydrogenase